MIFKVTYNQEYKRVIPAVLIDSRQNLPFLKSAGGYDVLAYTESQVDLVTERVVPYKIETEEGNLAGYFNLQVQDGNDDAAFLLNYQLRPAFQSFNSEILGIISNFISSNEWQFDCLL
mgnify:CR=1 FL=1